MVHGGLAQKELGCWFFQSVEPISRNGTLQVGLKVWWLLDLGLKRSSLGRCGCAPI